MSCASVLAQADDAPVLIKYTASYGTEQGVDNWYYYEYGKDGERELEYDSGKGMWKNKTADNPSIGVQNLNPGENDVGYKFVVPEKGMLRLRGKVVCPWPDGVKGDGIIASILKGDNVLWTSKAIYGQDASYDVYLSVRVGDELDFRINRNGTNHYDWVQWWPTVEYLGIEYVGEDDGYTYFEKKDGKLKQLELDKKRDTYIASDGVAFIDGYNVMPSEEYSLVKRFEVSEQGRYRVLCTLGNEDIRSGGTILKVYKNGEQVWEQLCTDSEKATLDVRIFSEQGDKIDVEVAVNEYVGYNYLDWDCRVTKFVGTLFCTASTSDGHNNGTIDEFALGSLVKVTQGNGVEFYSVKDDEKIPMKYNPSNNRWESESADGGYIAADSVNPGSVSDSVMEWTVTEGGTVRISGKLTLDSASDGVLTKIIHNDKEIWSNRVGGERPVRWDEPFDTSYFLNNVDVTARVQSGDKLTLLFNRWRKSANDRADISDITISYITGDTLSKTTRWKISHSIAVDTETKVAYKNNEKRVVSVFVENGTTYMSKSDIAYLFEKGSERKGREINGTEYLALRDVAEDNGNNVVWAADRLVLMHRGIPVFFGWPELSEIDTALKGGVLFE